MTDEELRAKLAASLSEVVADWLTESVQRLRRRLDALVSGMPAAEPETPVAGQGRGGTARMAIGPDAQPTEPGLPADLSMSHEPGCACGDCFALRGGCL
jgi:HAMP domain-containing protein